ncbi:hypothetical protein LguiB_018359 [Lonicera macranthoides]
MLELLLSTAALNNETLLLSKRNTIQLAQGEIDQIEAAASASKRCSLKVVLTSTIQLAHKKIDQIEATPVPVGVAVSKLSLHGNDMKD